MLDEEKVKLMAEIAVYEKKQHHELKLVGNYFKSDYVGGHMLKSVIAYTVGFGCVLGIVFIYQADAILQNLSFEGVDTTLILWGAMYVVGLLAYLLLVRKIYKKRYEKAARVTRLYIAKLKRLERRYEFQEKKKELSKGERNHDESAHI